MPQDIADQIIDWISEGGTLREFCRKPDMPAWTTVYKWLDKDDKFRERFARAREKGADAIAEEGLAILETFPLATGQDGKLDSAHVAWLKNRFEGRMKLLAKWFPQRYGEKVNLQHEGGVTLNVVTGVSDDD